MPFAWFCVVVATIVYDSLSDSLVWGSESWALVYDSLLILFGDDSWLQLAIAVHSSFEVSSAPESEPHSQSCNTSCKLIAELLRRARVRVEG